MKAVNALRVAMKGRSMTSKARALWNLTTATYKADALFTVIKGL